VLIDEIPYQGRHRHSAHTSGLSEPSMLLRGQVDLSSSPRHDGMIALLTSANPCM
jgi:hypothetical protein